MEKTNSKMVDKETMKLLTEGMLVKIKELRAHGYRVCWGYQIEYLITFRRSPISEDSGDIHKTYCWIYKQHDKDANYVGETRKNPKDCPNLKFARFISFTRAFDEFKKGEGNETE